MNIFKLNLKLILQILFVIIFFSTLHAKKPDKFDSGEHIADYFSGLLLLHNDEYKESYKYLKKLDGLEATHRNYSSKYLFSLINLRKFNEAFAYSRKLEKTQLSIFESDLIIGIYYLKNERFELAQKYFLKLRDRESQFIFNNFVSSSLLNWASFKTLDFNSAKKKIYEIDSKFKNLRNIQNVFLHCFYKSKKTEMLFKNLVSNEQIDFSRYNYFYANYLKNNGQFEKAKKVLNSSIESYPRNLLLNQFKLDLENDKYKNNFNCQNLSHVVAEILYITANALSSQNIYTFSNFYLNLSKYLNKDFHSIDTLLAENFYKIDNFKQARKIYGEIEKKGTAFLWYSAKQKAKIYIQEEKKEKALKILNETYEKLSEKSIYQKFDYARFLKNNEKFKNSIKLYTEILNSINSNHPLYPEVTEARGVAYERIGEWEKAEEDLLSSLKVSPDQAYVINYLAYSWIEKGVKISQSLEMLERANSLRSNDPYIIDSLGWALFKLERYSESKNYLQSAVKLMPADPIINDHYGDVLWKNGNKIEARYFWKHVLSLKDTEKDMKEKIKNKLISGL